jgi:hypothetical protein
MKTLLTKGRKRSTVDIDGEKTTIQELSLADSQSLKRDGEDEATTTLRLIIFSVIDDDGHKVYSDADLPALREVGLNTLKSLGNAIAELNGFEGTKAPKA